MDDWKKLAAEAAAAMVADGMIVGLGSGSTAAFAVEAIGRRVAAGLRITGIPTSEKTAELARSLGIPLTTLAEQPRIDLTIDGADEVERGTLNVIKGRGGALLREKIVASATRRLVIVADQSKIVDRLSAVQAPLPVEVVPFGWETTAQRLRGLGANPDLRATDGKTFITDGSHYILDCTFAELPMAAALDGIVGVVEHGLFIGMAAEAVVGGPAGVQILRRTGVYDSQSPGESNAGPT